MRGEAERARSGRLPQGTGRGLYGYSYNSTLGVREIDDAQAAVVNKILRFYPNGMSNSQGPGSMTECTLRRWAFH